MPLWALLVAGCAGTLAPTRFAAAIGDAPQRVGNGLVLSGAQLHDQPGSVLDVLARRVVGMQVRSSAGCPEITLRGRNSFFASPDPGIYVNGTPAVNSCILDTMNAQDVERVEVYPMGVAARAGYRNHPNGLILVFLRDH